MMNGMFVLSMLLLVRCQSFLLPTVARPSVKQLAARAAAAAATTAATTTSTNSTVVVKRNRQSMEFRKGSPLVFEGAISYTTGIEDPPQLAELVQVVVEQEKNNKGGKSKNYKHVGGDDKPQNTQPIGWGVYNPHSLYRVRILCHANLSPVLYKTLKNEDNSNTAMDTILHAKLQAAIQTRQALGLPSTATNFYRLLNGEGDGLSGLAMDVLGGSVVVIMSSAAWCQVYRDDIVRAVSEMLPDMSVVWKTTPSRLKQDGWEDKEEDVNDDTDVDQDETSYRSSGGS